MHKKKKSDPNEMSLSSTSNEFSLREFLKESDYVFAADDAEDNITLEQLENGSSKVISGTLVKLIERLTFEKYADPNYIQEFLYTYRAFTNSTEFLKMLVLRYQMPSPDKVSKSVLKNFEERRRTPVRLRVFNALKHWITEYWVDFEGDTALQNSLLEFVASTIRSPQNSSGVRYSAEILLKLLKKKRSGEEEENHYVFSTAPPESILPSPKQQQHFLSNGEPTNALSILDLDPKEVARQITLIEYKLLQSIHPWEFFDNAWMGATRNSDAPNIVVFTGWFNKVSNWGPTEIVRTSDQNVRLKLLIHFIDIAACCLGLKNYNGMMEIISGLQAPTVYNKTELWKKLPNKHRDLMRSFLELTSSKGNYENYRAAVEAASAPMVPYLGCYLTDLVTIQNAIPGTVKKNENTLINFNKFRKMADIIKKVNRAQQTPFCLKPVIWIMKFLKRIKVVEEETRRKWVDEERAFGKSLQSATSTKNSPVKDSSTASVSVKVRLPGSPKIEKMTIIASKTSEENIKDFVSKKTHSQSMNSVFSPGQVSPEIPFFVIGTSEADAGTIIPHETRLLDTPGFPDTVLDVWLQPTYVKVAYSDTGTLDIVCIPNTEMLLAFTLPLKLLVYVFQSYFKIPVTEDFIFFEVDPSGAEETKWICTTKDLEEQHFNAEKHFLLVYPLAHFKASPEVVRGLMFNPEKAGMLTKQSRKKSSRETASERRWFVLKENVLLYFKKKEDTLPVGVIALEYFKATVSKEGTVIKLVRILKEHFASKLEYYIIHADTPIDLSAWYHGIKKIPCMDPAEMSGNMLIYYEDEWRKRHFAFSSSSDVLYQYKNRKDLDPETVIDFEEEKIYLFPLNEPGVKDTWMKGLCLVLEGAHETVYLVVPTVEEKIWWIKCLEVRSFNFHPIEQDRNITLHLSSSKIPKSYKRLQKPVSFLEATVLASTVKKKKRLSPIPKHLSWGAGKSRSWSGPTQKKPNMRREIQSAQYTRQPVPLTKNKRSNTGSLSPTNESYLKRKSLSFEDLLNIRKKHEEKKKPIEYKFKEEEGRLQVLLKDDEDWKEGIDPEEFGQVFFKRSSRDSFNLKVKSLETQLNQTSVEPNDNQRKKSGSRSDSSDNFNI